MTYINFPIKVSAEDVLQDAYDYLQGKFPSWRPNDANLDTAIEQAWATEAATLRELASNVPDSIFRWFGATLAQLPPVDAAAAKAQTTWTMVDNAGYTIPAGTQVSISAAGDEHVPFTTVADVVVTPGSNVTAAGAVQIVAVDAGAASSGLGAPAGPVNLEDPLAFVASITQVAATAGGVDAEDDPTYLGRLREELATMAPRLILPNDFSVAAKQVDTVWRALALDGYDPGADTFGHPREITLAIIDVAGNNMAPGVKTDVQLYCEDRREVNFIVNVIDSTQTQIDVTFTVAAVAGYDHADLLTRCETALSSFLTPASWGQDPNVRDASAGRSWVNTPVVRFQDISTILNNVEGVDHWTILTIALHGGGMGAVDLNLPGAAPLAKTGTLVGAVI